MNDSKIILKSFAVLGTTYKRSSSKIHKIQTWIGKKYVITKYVFPCGIGFHCVGKQLHSNACCSQYCFNLPFFGTFVLVNVNLIQVF